MRDFDKRELDYNPDYDSQGLSGDPEQGSENDHVYVTNDGD